MRRLLFSSSAVLAIGCATPTSGDYTFEETGSVTTCPATAAAADDAAPDPVSVVVSDEEATVTILGVEFPLVGNSFRGIVIAQENDYTDAGIDASVSTYSDMAGSWVSNSRITGTQSFETTCEGSYCVEMEARGAIYCGGTIEFEATRIE